MSPRSLEVRPTYRKRRFWPWVLGAAILLGVGLWEIGVHRRVQPALPVPGAQAPAARSGPATASPRGVSGQVVTAEGEAAPGVEVTVVPDGPTTRSDGQGRFELPVDDGTELRIEAHHSDLGFAGAESSAPASGLQLRLAPRAEVRVRVVSEGRPVVGALVFVRPLLRATGVFQADRDTDAAGELRFLGLPPGRLLVEARLEASGAHGVTSVEAVDGAVTEATVSLRGVASGPGAEGARQGPGR